MFFTIFKHELKYWLKQPAFYIYTVIFFTAALAISATQAGFFDSLTATTGSSQIVNAPIEITALFNGLASLIFFLFPSIVGVSVYRDYKSEMHTILYSYPFSKTDYLFAKFFSSILTVTAIVLAIGMGMFIGFRLPGTNADIVGTFNAMSYFSAYGVYILPDILLFGAIVFAVVTFTRSITAGFMTVIFILLIQGVTVTLLSNPDGSYLAAILGPFGAAATDYYTKYWTVAERNTSPLPMQGVIIYNRLLWLAIAALVFGLVYKLFTFSQDAPSFSFRSQKPERITSNNLGGITRVVLPKVNFDFSFLQHLKTTWKLSNIDLKYIVTSWSFIGITLAGLMVILFEHVENGVFRGTPMLPVTWKMLRYSEAFMFAVHICTFLYAGMLIHRANIANLNQLLDTTPIPNWALLASKVMALLKMQLVMVTVIMITGILFQIYNGYYKFEIGLYLFGLYVLHFLYFLLWALLAMFVQTLIRNPYVGLFLMIVILLSIPILGAVGVEQDVFLYGQTTTLGYSDMNGYGNYISSYFIYEIYWLLGGLIFLILAGLCMVRGLPHSFKERFIIARSRFTGSTAVGFTGLLIGFLAIGFTIYYESNIQNEWISSKKMEALNVGWEKTYKKYEHHQQPRIVSVKTAVNIYPGALNFDAEGTYVMVNKSEVAIDSIFLKYNDFPSTFTFNKESRRAVRDTVYDFDIYQLKRALQPGDSLALSFTVKNRPNTWLRTNSPVLSNGTFINNFQLFPFLGYIPSGELIDDEIRKNYGLPPNDLQPHPSDSTAWANHIIRKDSDWIDFETTVSTSEDQMAIAPGYLQKEWIADGRRYFHYKMDSKILNFYAFNSARYEVMKETWQDIDLEIYYHKGHEYNLDRMMAGMKAAIAYNAKNFSPYQHKQARIIEFPKTYGNFAQSFPNTIPFSEGHGFIADVDDTDHGGVDYAFAVTAHEIAHQWWAHQVIGADVLGSTVLSESLSDYVRLKVLEHQYGKSKMRTFLKYALDDYLRDRGREKKRENALMYNDGQPYIRYSKGSLVFYAVSDYIGEYPLNAALSTYVEKVKFQEPPYTTAIELVDHIRAVTPDSLQYIIKDLFETVTLYDNKVVDVNATPLDNGKYQIEIEFNVSKYRNDVKGKRLYDKTTEDYLSYQTEEMEIATLSVPLADYIDIGIFTDREVDGKKTEVELYLKKHKMTTIHNKLTIIVDEKPTEVGVDPYNKLIDTNSEDNRKGV